MTLLAFLLGLALGVGLLWLQRRRWQYQLDEAIAALSDRGYKTAKLPRLTRLRREAMLAEETVRQLQAQLQGQRDLWDAAPVGYLQVDAYNQLQWCNQQARQLLGLNRWHPDRDPARLLLELVRSYELDQLIQQTRETQQPQEREWVLYRTESAHRPSEVDALTLRGTSLPLAQSQVGVFLQNQQPLVDLAQARDRAFSDITHELRTPLTSIALVAENLQKRLQPPEQRWAERLLQQTHRSIRLVENCLELSRLQQNPSQHLSRKPLDLRQVIGAAWATLQPAAQERGIELAYRGPEQLQLTADRDRLVQVLVNLLDNAIEHSPDGEAVRVEVYALDASQAQIEREAVCIDVIDAGPGFGEVELARAFERLYRGKTPEGTETGTGLGLPIARQIALAHGGTIAAQNHPQTGGAWLQLELPVAD